MLCTYLKLPYEEYERALEAFHEEWNDTLLASVSVFMKRIIPFMFRDSDGRLCCLQHGAADGHLAGFESLHAFRKYVMSHSNCGEDETIYLYSCYSATLPKTELEEENIEVPISTCFPINFILSDGCLGFGEVIMQNDVIDTANLISKIVGLSFELSYQSVCGCFGGQSPFDPNVKWNISTENLWNIMFPEERGLFS
jgi:hypothetical protein